MIDRESLDVRIKRCYSVLNSIIPPTPERTARMDQAWANFVDNSDESGWTIDEQFVGGAEMMGDALLGTIMGAGDLEPAAREFFVPLVFVIVTLEVRALERLKEES